MVPVATYFGVREEYAYLKTSIARFPLGTIIPSTTPTSIFDMKSLPKPKRDFWRLITGFLKCQMNSVFPTVCMISGAEQERLAADEGFSKAVHYELAGGLMGVLVATK